MADGDSLRDQMKDEIRECISSHLGLDTMAFVPSKGTRKDFIHKMSCDLADVVFLIDYLYRNGPAPFPYQAGDATCDGLVDLADVVFLINYLYREGPVPDCS